LAFRSLTWFSSWPFALLLGFFADVCSVFRLSLSDLVLRRRLFNSLPFALGLVSCLFAFRSWICSLSLRRRLFSCSIDHLYVGFYTLVNAKTSSCELQTLYLWCAPLYSRTTVHFTFLLATIAVFGVLVGRQHSSFQCVGVPHYHWYHAHRLRIPFISTWTNYFKSPAAPLRQVVTYILASQLRRGKTCCDYVPA